MPIVNIPIKILAEPHTHSRSSSTSSVHNDRPQNGHQNGHQMPHINTNNMPNSQSGPSPNPNIQSNFSHSGRSPMPDSHFSDFPNFPTSTRFTTDADWPNFPNFPDFPTGFQTSGLSPNPNFPNFPNLSRDGGLSPNPTMQSMRRSPTPSATASPTGTLRRNSATATAQPNIPNNGQTQNKPTSRPQSRASHKEPREPEIPDRPAVIPLPYERCNSKEKSTSRKNSEEKEDKPLEENIAKIQIGKDESTALKHEEADDVPSPLTSPTDDKPRRGRKLQRNQSVVDYNAKTIVTLDKIELQVEQLRKDAAELELKKDQILRSLEDINVHSCMLKLAECDREEIEAITERLTKRTKTVQVLVETPRNEEQKRALENATQMIDEVNEMVKSNVEKAKLCLTTYLNACASEETTGATCANFLKIIIQCTADDQKRIKRRLENLMSQIENAEKTTADLLEDDY